jgi:hypothetical protein
MRNLNFVNESEWFAQDLRHVWEFFIEGTVADDALEVTAGGTGLSVDVNEGVGFVQGDTDTDQGLYRVLAEAAVNSDDFLDGGWTRLTAATPELTRSLLTSTMTRSMHPEILASS